VTGAAGEREAFEAWARSEGCENLSRHRDGTGAYLDGEVLAFWVGWSARAPSAAFPAAKDAARLDWLAKELRKHGRANFEGGARRGTVQSVISLFTVSSQWVKGDNIREAIDAASHSIKEGARVSEERLHPGTLEEARRLAGCLPTFTDEHGIRTFVDYRELMDLFRRLKERAR